MAIIKTKFDRGVEGATNIVDSGTAGTKVASGTTAQRGSTTGQWRYNTTTGFFEGRNATGTFSTLEPDPLITSIAPTTATTANQSIVISGANFFTGSTIKFIGNDGTEYSSPSVTVNSVSQITATTPSSALPVSNEPYDVQITSATNKVSTLADALDAGGSPTWSTASGTLATIQDNATGTHATVSASDPDGQTIAYSETASVLSGQNLSINSSTGAISGDPTDVNSSTTHSFTLRASDGTNTTDRAFNIIVNPTLDGSNSGRAATSAVALSNLGITTNGTYWLKPSGGSGSAFQAYCLLDKYGGGWVKIAQYYNNSNILNNSSAINAGGGWTTALKSLNDGKLTNTDIHAIQSNGTNDSFLLAISNGGISDSLAKDSGGTNRGFLKFERPSGLSNFGTNFQVTGTNRWHMDSDANGTFELVGEYNGSVNPCGHTTSYWVVGHNSGTYITGSSPTGSAPDMCWTFGSTSLHTNLHGYSGTSSASGGSVQWGNNSNNSVAIFIK